MSESQLLESFQRVYRLPVVESSVQIANNLYQKVKTTNPIVNWTLNQTEQTFWKAAEKATPLVTKLEKPIKQVDSILCTGLDYVEVNVPVIKLPPQDLLASIVFRIREYLNAISPPKSTENAANHNETNMNISNDANLNDSDMSLVNSPAKN